MLSYRHGFHAGNFADVLKHITQTLIIDALKEKPKPFVYYDTHAGAGRYDLSTDVSLKTAEFKSGIAEIWQRTDIPKSVKPYVEIIRQLNANGELKYYPGSPLIARELISRNNRLELTDLHPADFKLLKQEFVNDRNVRVQQKDGYKNLLSQLPPIQRRALILIDPSYELNGDYKGCANNVIKAHKLFATGIYAIWHPIIARKCTDQFYNMFKLSGIKNILKIELCIKQYNEDYGMTGTGMVIINPPWKLKQQLEETLPWLAKHLQQDNFTKYSIEWLVPE